MCARDLRFSQRGEALIGQTMFTVLDEARRLEADGSHIYHLELGNPRLPPPATIVSRTIESLRALDVGYTQSGGHPALREAVARRYSDIYNHPIGPDNVVVSPANLIINQFLDIMCDRGGRVVFFTPAFPTYWAAALHSGIEVLSVPLDPASGYDLSQDAVTRALALNPCAIIVNSANNPTGAVYDREPLERLARECEARGIWLLSDETYGEISFGKPFYSLGPLDLPHVVIMSSFSKILSVPGFRIGYLIAHPAVAGKFALSVSTLLSCLPIFTQMGCAMALETLSDYTDLVKRRCIEITDWCSAQLARTNRIGFTAPAAGFYFFLDVSSSGMDDVAFSHLLLEEERTAVTPGSSFGDRYTSHIRVATCGAPGDVREGIRRIISLVDRL